LLNPDKMREEAERKWIDVLGDDHIAEVPTLLSYVPFDVCQWEIFVDGRVLV
jgi:hypothetical protein